MVDAEESTFQALHKFRALSVEDRLETLFLEQRDVLAETRTISSRLDTLNGSVESTACSLKKHLDEHAREEAGLRALRLWGGRGVAAILLFLAIAGGVMTVLSILDFFAHY